MNRRGSATVAVLLAVVMTIISAVYVVQYIRADYQFDTQFGSMWSLSEKASSLDKKREYLDRYLAAVDSAHFTGNNALFWPTPDNDVQQNITVIKSLQTRMHEIATVDVGSMAYQQAIQQITAQEQGEATATLNVIEGVWYRDHHPAYWNLYGGLCIVGLILGWIVVAGFTVNAMD